VVVVDVVVVDVVVVDVVVVDVDVLGAVAGADVDTSGAAFGDDEHPAARTSETVNRPTETRDIGQS